MAKCDKTLLKRIKGRQSVQRILNINRPWLSLHYFQEFIIQKSKSKIKLHKDILQETLRIIVSFTSIFNDELPKLQSPIKREEKEGEQLLSDEGLQRSFI